MSDSPSAVTPVNPSAFQPTHPFDKAAGADAILRSSDGADFYVHRAILSLVSPVFESMFRLPQPQDSAPEHIDLPVIDVTETSSALDRALRVFYPGTYPADPQTLAELGEAIEVLMKYDVECQVPVLKRHLAYHHASSPLSVYAIAIRHGWRDAALVAARQCLKQPLRSTFTDHPRELDGITGSAYQNLLEYHHTCGEVARNTAASPTWLTLPPSNCGCHKASAPIIFANNQTLNVAAWLHKYLTDTGDILARCPGVNVSQAASLNAAITHPNTCGYCAQFDLLHFLTLPLSQQIKVELDRVELKF
ncbi:hypothetical protein FB45DRAFT_1055717 [Roridomyces roridus]|uniref:BTB domain-containing protein n=1 Tax=Roridomyces roridus TaxID=1738132 RepID=A0AAD7C0V8_9AGAR|nr:hypothetical protein FB45DRAFT_1055717 [Roridomyces roridus]